MSITNIYSHTCQRILLSTIAGAILGTPRLSVLGMDFAPDRADADELS